MPYSQDLRERVIAAVRAKQQSLDQIAETFGVSASTVDKWVETLAEDAQRRRLTLGGRRPAQVADL